MKKLDLPYETSIEAGTARGSPPPPALTAAETATDLTLFVQELIKLRSSGRTRRYEVLARSQRDAGRNEVPAAFIAETAQGQRRRRARCTGCRAPAQLAGRARRGHLGLRARQLLREPVDRRARRADVPERIGAVARAVQRARRVRRLRDHRIRLRAVPAGRAAIRRSVREARLLPRDRQLLVRLERVRVPGLEGPASREDRSEAHHARR